MLGQYQINKQTNHGTLHWATRNNVLPALLNLKIVLTVTSEWAVEKPVVNFISILQAAFLRQYSCAKKLQSQTETREKVWKGKHFGMKKESIKC